MKRRIGVAIAAVLLGLAALLSGAAVRADNGGVPAESVQAKAVGHGLKLWVFVHYAKGGKPGPPGGGGSVNCTDTNSQTGFATPFAFASTSGLTFHVNNTTIPSGLSQTDVDSALTNPAAAAWNGVSGIPSSYLKVATDGSETVPAQDGTSTIGWVRLVPKNVLAATWTWTNATTNRVVEADIFYNNTQPWAVFSSCPSSPTSNFDVADIGTHEMGHALGLSHYSDSEAQATLYPSAPRDEVRKTTLTAGDAQAFRVAFAGG